MNPRLTLIALTAAPLAPALAQTDTLLRFDHPGGFQPGWGHTLVPVGDLDGDGADELAIGTFLHGGGEIATVHSGRTGVPLYSLDGPVGPLFFGDAIVVLSDETGDGLPELAAIGSHSGDASSPDGLILVYSGADGAPLRQVAPQAGVLLPAHMQGNTFSAGDVDGDGSDDLWFRTPSVSGGWPLALTLLSGQTGQVLASAAPPPPAAFVGDQVAQLSDHDGDGRNDFAVVAHLGSVEWAEIRSGATGALIAQLTPSELDNVTGNGEPFLGVADLDGDGLRELAVGEVFGGSVTIYSTATGVALRRWGCDTQPISCFGSRLVEVGDMNGNGHPDLVALESNVFGSGGIRLFGLDPSQKNAFLFEELIPGLDGGYSNADRLAPLPGGDRSGHPTFVLFEELTNQVAVRRFALKFDSAR